VTPTRRTASRIAAAAAVAGFVALFVSAGGAWPGPWRRTLMALCCLAACCAWAPPGRRLALGAALAGLYLVFRGNRIAGDGWRREAAGAALIAAAVAGLSCQGTT